MRRLGLLWALSLLLVFVQQAALLHEIGHLHHGAQTEGATVQADSGSAGNAPCPTCQGFAQATNLAFSSPLPDLAGPTGLMAAAEACRALRGTDIPTPRSRGPPQV